MSTGPSCFPRSRPRTRHRRRSARSSERLGFKESKADISASRRRDLKQSATPSPTPLPVKRCGSTRNFRRGLTTAVTRKTPSRWTRCLTTLVCIGSQILQRRLLGYTGKTPRVVVQASRLGASSCRWLQQSSRGRFFVRQRNGLKPSGRTCSTGTNLTRVGTSPLSSSQSCSSRRCATHSSHREDDRPRHLGIRDLAQYCGSTASFWCRLRLRDAANWERWLTNGRFTAARRNRDGNRSAGDKESFNDTTRESYAR